MKKTSLIGTGIASGVSFGFIFGLLPPFVLPLSNHQ